MVEGLLCLYVHARLKLLQVFVSQETEFMRKVLNVPGQFVTLGGHRAPEMD